MRLPIQPIKKTDTGILRFVQNKIVRKLLDDGGFDLYQIALWDVSKEEHAQFAQLIGYSLSGFGDLDYVSDEIYETAAKMAESDKTEIECRCEYLEETIAEVKKGMKTVIPALYRINADDLDDEYS